MTSLSFLNTLPRTSPLHSGSLSDNPVPGICWGTAVRLGIRPGGGVYPDFLTVLPCKQSYVMTSCKYTQRKDKTFLQQYFMPLSPGFYPDLIYLKIWLQSPSGFQPSFGRLWATAWGSCQQKIRIGEGRAQRTESLPGHEQP